LRGITAYADIFREELGARLREAVLDRYNRQGWYGECFVQALAAAAGLTVAKENPDLTGIDFHIKGTQEVRDDFPRMEVQVKSWSTPSRQGTLWHYRGLTEKQFNHLAGRRTVPAFLFLVVVPSDGAGYATADENFLRLSHAAYWVSLEHMPKIPQPSSERKVLVAVPRQNLLTVESLIALCQDGVIGKGTPQQASAAAP
jgi:hypothetical protein